MIKGQRKDEERVGLHVANGLEILQVSSSQKSFPRARLTGTFGHFTTEESVREVRITANKANISSSKL